MPLYHRHYEPGQLQFITSTYPSVSPNVVSAGGTSLQRDANGNFTGEVVWNDQYGGTGGGTSRYESRPSYQNAVSSIVGSKRGTPDFSFDADPASGVSVYDRTVCSGQSGWLVFGGTRFPRRRWRASSTWPVPNTAAATLN